MSAKWILANGVGMALGFLAFVNVVFFVAVGFQFELYWTEAQDDLENAEELSKRWLVLWSLGLRLGMVAFVLTYLRVDVVFAISWAAEVGLIGFAIGARAPALSGHAPFQALSGEAEVAA
jgi:hypothetical protein